MYQPRDQADQPPDRRNKRAAEAAKPPNAAKPAGGWPPQGPWMAQSRRPPNGRGTQSRKNGPQGSCCKKEQNEYQQTRQRTTRKHKPQQRATLNTTPNRRHATWEQKPEPQTFAPIADLSHTTK